LPYGSHDSFIDVVDSIVAVNLLAFISAPLKQKLMVLKLGLSFMLSIGFSVLFPAHDTDAGLLLSSKTVLFLAPGNGHPLEFILPYVDALAFGALVDAEAHTG
jgi:hypothetical protein